MSHFPKNKTFLKMTSLDEKKHDCPVIGFDNANTYGAPFVFFGWEIYWLVCVKYF